MPAEHLGDLFARFWRRSDKAGGCGLGLSIVDEIALRHAGQTFAEPVAPHGLRVGISLPALPPKNLSGWQEPCSDGLNQLSEL